MTNILIIGGGGHARVVLSLLRKTGNWNPIGYTALENRGTLDGIPYLGGDGELTHLKEQLAVRSCVIGIGNTAPELVREAAYQRALGAGFELPAIISPHAVVDNASSIGGGTVVMNGAVVNVGTVVGKCSILNTNCTVDHDCLIGDFVHIAPGATLSGGVHVGHHGFIGTGASVIQGVVIGEGCLVGAGSAVIRDLESKTRYAGTPARRIS